MNAQQASGMPGRSPFEAVAQDLTPAMDAAYPTDELSHPEYVNDEFRMFTFKVMKCPKRYVHDWRSCPFAHPTENARRRDPREVRYMPVPCPDYKRGLCLMGDSCTYSHGVYECWLHPAKYRTQLCKDGGQCRRPVCFFAHSVSELRSPTYTWDAETLGPEGQPTGLHQGALAPGQVPGGAEMGSEAAAMPYPNVAHGQIPYQQQDFHQPMDPHQAPMHPYPPGQPPSPYSDPYYGPQPGFAQGPEPYMGMPINHHDYSPQFGSAVQQGFSSPFQAAGAPRLYPPPARSHMDVMGHLPHVSPYQREQQRLQTMHRFHSQQLSQQLSQQQQQQQQQAQRQPSGPTPAGSLPAPGVGARAPSSELGELLGVGAGPGTTAPRMSNAMARSLGLVPPKETRTRTLGALAGLMQGPRATSLTDGLNRPQMSYSLPAQLPDPDQHMHEVYLAAQAAAAATGNSQGSGVQAGAQRQPSVGLPPTVAAGAINLSQSASQALRQASVGSAQRQGSLGLPQGQGSLGLAPGQGTMARAPSMPVGGSQRQGSAGLPQGVRHGSGTLSHETTPQDMQGWQLGLQQGIEQALQQGPRQDETAHQAQERSMIEQMQKLGLFADGAKHLLPHQLQSLVSMLHKQDASQTWSRPSTSLASHTIPEVPDELAEAPSDKETLASLLSSFQSMGLIQEQPSETSQIQPAPQSGATQAQMASPFASPEHAPKLDIFESLDANTVGSNRPWRQTSHSRQLSSTASSASSTGAGGLTAAASVGSKSPSPFASRTQQLPHISSNSSLGSVPGKSPSGRISQPVSRQASSPLVPTATSVATSGQQA